MTVTMGGAVISFNNSSKCSRSPWGETGRARLPASAAEPLVRSEQRKTRSRLASFYADAVPASSLLGKSWHDMLVQGTAAALAGHRVPSCGVPGSSSVSTLRYRTVPYRINYDMQQHKRHGVGFVISVFDTVLRTVHLLRLYYRYRTVLFTFRAARARQHGAAVCSMGAAGTAVRHRRGCRPAGSADRGCVSRGAGQGAGHQHGADFA